MGKPVSLNPSCRAQVSPPCAQQLQVTEPAPAACRGRLCTELASIRSPSGKKDKKHQHTKTKSSSEIKLYL